MQTPKSSASSFLVNKHSWKGKYRRVLTVGEDLFSTYNPSSMEVTNSWKLSDVVGMQPLSAPGDLEFQITFRKGPKKTDNMRFSSEWRATLLTEGLRWLQRGGNDGATAVTKVFSTPSKDSWVLFLNTHLFFRLGLHTSITGPSSVCPRQSEWETMLWINSILLAITGFWPPTSSVISQGCTRFPIILVVLL